MTPLKLHTAAWALIADPKHWTQGAMARHSNDTKTTTHDPDAYKFCSMGALKRVWGNDISHEQDLLFIVYDALRTAMKGVSITAYNDQHTHTQVMTMWKKAGAILKEQST